MVYYALDTLLCVLYFTIRRNHALHQHMDWVGVFMIMLCTPPCCVGSCLCCSSVRSWSWGWLLCNVQPPLQLRVIMLIIWVGDGSLKCHLSSRLPSTLLGMLRRNVPKGSLYWVSGQIWATPNIKRTSTVHTYLDSMKALAWLYGKQVWLEQLLLILFDRK